MHNRNIINIAIVISGGLTLESKCSIPLQESVILSSDGSVSRPNYIIFRLMIPCEGETLSSEGYSRRSIFSNFLFTLSCNGIEHFDSKVNPPEINIAIVMLTYI